MVAYPRYYGLGRRDVHHSYLIYISMLQVIWVKTIGKMNTQVRITNNIPLPVKIPRPLGGKTILLEIEVLSLSLAVVWSSLNRLGRLLIPRSSKRPPIFATRSKTKYTKNKHSPASASQSFFCSCVCQMDFACCQASHINQDGGARLSRSSVVKTPCLGTRVKYT